MLNLKEIEDVKFRKSSIGGYKTEDVEDFIKEVTESYKSLQGENKNILEKIKFLADKVNEYRDSEESIRIAVNNAQKFADASIKDAKAMAKNIISDAEKEAYTLLNKAQTDISKYTKELKELKQSARDFRSKILNLYKEHLKLVNSIPSDNRVTEEMLEKSENSNVYKLNQDNKDHEDSRDIFSGGKDILDVSAAGQSNNKFKNLKFGENYDLKEDLNVKNTGESPVGLFKNDVIS